MVKNPRGARREPADLRTYGLGHIFDSLDQLSWVCSGVRPGACRPSFAAGWRMLVSSGEALDTAP
jgi:hypothetical protein